MRVFLITYLIKAITTRMDYRSFCSRFYRLIRQYLSWYQTSLERLYGSVQDKAIVKKISKKQKRKKKKKKKKKGVGRIKKRIKKRKERYVAKIRKLRRYLSEIKEKKIISIKEYQYLRRLSKAGHFRTRRHLKEYLSGVLKKTIENKHEKTNKSTVQKKKAK